MVPCAPRYDSRVVEAIRALDDRGQPVAATWRAVGRVAEHLGLVRPSYNHVLRLVREERDLQAAAEARREELRAIAADVATDLIVGRFVHPYEVAARVEAARGS